MYKEAIPELYATLVIKDIKEAWINLGLCYKELHIYDKARQCLERARTTPYASGQMVLDDSASMHNIGSIAYIMQEDEMARNYYWAAFEADPTNAEAAWNYGCAGIRRFCDGKSDTNLLQDWFYYDHRFTLYDLTVVHDDLELWDFSSVHMDSGVVVLRDQGRGDTLMFARYLPELEKYFGKVYVQSDPYMETLFDYEPYRPDSSVQYAVPMCSLGKLLDYIPPGDFLRYRRTAPIREGKLKVGCVWKGTPGHPNDHNRSCPAKYFDSLTGIDKYTIGPNEEREGYTHLSSVALDTTELWENTASWEYTIVNLNKLDLVITVDTAIAHFCGCLGMECWVIMPLTYSDYRWGTAAGSGDRTIWYDSLRIIRNEGSWEETFAKVQERINDRH